MEPQPTLKSWAFCRTLSFMRMFSRRKVWFPAMFAKRPPTTMFSVRPAGTPREENKLTTSSEVDHIARLVLLECLLRLLKVAGGASASPLERL